MAQRNGTGMFPGRDAFPLLPLGEEEWLNYLSLREKFIERVLAARLCRGNCTTAWTRMLDEEPTPGGLVPVPAVRAGKFHTAHKLTRAADQCLLRAMARRGAGAASSPMQATRTGTN